MDMGKRILMVSAFPPCQKTAGEDYTRLLLFDLVEKGCHIDLIYAEYPGHEAEIPDQVKILQTLSPSLINCIKRPYVHPFFSRRYNVKIRKMIQQIAEEYDMLYFDFTQVHYYAKFIKHPCKVLMCHDVIYQKYARKTGVINTSWIKYWEKKLLLTAKESFTFSKKDSDVIEKMYRIKTIPINFYLKTEKFEYSKRVKVADKMCFYGAWNRAENIEAIEMFIDKIFPLLKKKKRFEVIGGGMSRQLKEKLENIGFECLGFVENPLLNLAECQALIAPLKQGAGVKVKVIDSLTVGLSVIGTVVAFEGIEDNENNKLFFRANTMVEFAEIIDNWENVTRSEKQEAADEFYKRYSGNHFTDYMNLI